MNRDAQIREALGDQVLELYKLERTRYKSRPPKSQRRISLRSLSFAPLLSLGVAIAAAIVRWRP